MAELCDGVDSEQSKTVCMATIWWAGICEAREQRLVSISHSWVLCGKRHTLRLSDPRDIGDKNLSNTHPFVAQHQGFHWTQVHGFPFALRVLGAVRGSRAFPHLGSSFPSCFRRTENMSGELKNFSDDKLSASGKSVKGTCPAYPFCPLFVLF